MIGMVGVIIQNDVIVNTTNIMREIKPGEKYLVRFLNPPAFQRVCSIEEIQQWILFQNEKEGQEWIDANASQQQINTPQPGMEVVPGPTPPPGQHADGTVVPEPKDNGNGAATPTPAIDTLPGDTPVVEPPEEPDD